MNIFLREMKANRKALIIWCISVIFMVGAGMGKYTSISVTGQSLNDLIAQMPKSLLVVMDLGTFDLSKASGYYGVLFLYLVVMATIHAAMLGASIISKEERDKTSEFLFVKPVSRISILTAKFIAALVNVIIFNLVTLISSIVIVGKLSKGENVTGEIWILMVGMFILQLIFLVLGTGIAAFNKNPKTATSISTAILLITFILAKYIDLNGNIEFLEYLTPFKYFEAKTLMNGGGLEPVFVILSGFVILALSAVTYIFFKQRDLNV